MPEMTPLLNWCRVATKVDSAFAGVRRCQGVGWLYCSARLMSRIGRTCSNPKPDVSCILVTIDSLVMNYTRLEAEISYCECVLRRCILDQNQDWRFRRS